MRLAVMNEKGGCGKTTTAVHVAGAWAELGRRVLLVDADVQGQSAVALGVAPGPGLAEVLEGASPDSVLVEARPGLWLLRGGLALSRAKRAISREDVAPHLVLSRALGGLFRRFPLVLFDSSPSWDALSVNVACAAEAVLAPVNPEALAVHGLGSLLASLEPVRQVKRIDVRHLVPTLLDARVRKTRDVVEGLRARFPGLVRHGVRYSVRVSESAGRGLLVWEYRKGDGAGADYRALAKELAP